MRLPTLFALGLTAILAVPTNSFAGDREAVADELAAISGNWNDAFFSIDVKGVSDGEAQLGQRLQVAYEAALPGYFAYLRVSSHGDMTLSRDQGRSGRVSGRQDYIVRPPLGAEQLLVFFSSSPWDDLFPHGGASRDLGSDRAAAKAFVQALAQRNDQQVLVAERNYQFSVLAPQGGTEYTTRGIIRQVEEARQGHAATGGTARIPSRIEFEFNSDRLTDQGKLDLDTFGEALATELRGAGVSLEGHTDAVGSDDYNQALSERRAMAAKQYLVDSFSIATSRLSTVGFGKSNPVASNEDPAGRSRNRRVDFVFAVPGPASAAP
jgi:outer membrane protein OmpA-like peptidoglycan-associated protein